MTDIFISYSQKDKTLVTPVFERLKRLGLDVFMDVKIDVGESFAKVADQHVRDAKAVLVFWTPNSARSAWVTAECLVAYDDQKLIPVWLEKCRLQLPFTQLNTEDLHNWDGEPGHSGWKRTLDSIGRRLGFEGLSQLYELTHRAELLFEIPSHQRSEPEHDRLVQLAKMQQKSLTAFGECSSQQVVLLSELLQRIEVSLKQTETESSWRTLEGLTATPVAALHQDFFLNLKKTISKVQNWAALNPDDRRCLEIPELLHRIGAAYAETACIRIKSRILGQLGLIEDARILLDQADRFPTEVSEAINESNLSRALTTDQKSGFRRFISAAEAKLRYATWQGRAVFIAATAFVIVGSLWSIFIAAPSTVRWQSDRMAWSRIQSPEDVIRFHANARTPQYQSLAAQKVIELDHEAFAAARRSDDAQAYLNYVEIFGKDARNFEAAMQWLAARGIDENTYQRLSSAAAEGHIEPVRDLILHFPTSADAAKYQTFYEAELDRMWESLDKENPDDLLRFKELFPHSSQFNEIAPLIRNASAEKELEVLLKATASSDSLGSFVRTFQGTPAAERALDIRKPLLLAEASSDEIDKVAIRKLTEYLSLPEVDDRERAESLLRERQLSSLLSVVRTPDYGCVSFDDIEEWIARYGEVPSDVGRLRAALSIPAVINRLNYCEETEVVGRTLLSQADRSLAREALDTLFGQAGPSTPYPEIRFKIIDDLGSNPSFKVFRNELVLATQAIEQSIGNGAVLDFRSSTYEDHTDGSLEREIENILGRSLKQKIFSLVDDRFIATSTDSAPPGQESFVGMFASPGLFSPYASGHTYFASLNHGYRSDALSKGLDTGYCSPSLADTEDSSVGIAIETVLSAIEEIRVRISFLSEGDAVSDYKDFYWMFVPMTVTAQDIELKSYPSRSASVVGQVSKSIVLAKVLNESSSPFINVSRLRIPGFDGMWAFVYLAEGKRGWVSAENVVPARNEDGEILGGRIARHIHTCFVTRGNTWKVLEQDLMEPW